MFSPRISCFDFDNALIIIITKNCTVEHRKCVHTYFMSSPFIALHLKCNSIKVCGCFSIVDIYINKCFSVSEYKCIFICHFINAAGHFFPTESTVTTES